MRVAGVLSVSKNNITWYSNSSSDSQCGQALQRVGLPPSCQPCQTKLRKPGYDYAQYQPRFNQERLNKCSIGNRNRFNQNRFRLKRLIPIEHDLRYECINYSRFWISIATNLNFKDETSPSRCKQVFKGATSRITHLEKTGKFFQVCHS